MELDRNWLILWVTVIVTCTLMIMQQCHYDHEANLKCIEAGHKTFPNGNCDFTGDKK